MPPLDARAALRITEPQVCARLDARSGATVRPRPFLVRLASHWRSVPCAHDGVRVAWTSSRVVTLSATRHHPRAERRCRQHITQYGRCGGPTSCLHFAPHEVLRTPPPTAMVRLPAHDGSEMDPNAPPLRASVDRSLPFNRLSTRHTARSWHNCRIREHVPMQPTAPSLRAPAPRRRVVGIHGPAATAVDATLANLLRLGATVF